MANEVIIDQKHGFMEMLLSARETSDGFVSESKSISYDKTIDNVQNVQQLNNTYKFLIDNARDSSWKKPLMDKCEILNAKFNQETKLFERASI